MSSEECRNVWLLGLDMAIFSMGLGALDRLTVIPLFVSKLIENPLAIGAVAAAIQIGWLPQLVVTGAVERRAQKWPWVTRFSTYGPLPSLTLALCAPVAPLLERQVVLFGYGWLFGLSAAVALASLLVLGPGARAPARRAA